MTTPKVTTTFIAGDRWYVDDAQGIRVPGVSAIKDMLPKPALGYARAREAAIFAVDNIEAVAALAKTDRKAAIDLVKSAANRAWENKADTGTNVHSMVEQLMRDQIAGRKSTFRVTPEEKRYLVHFARFHKEFKVRPILVETTVWDSRYDYAGTFDLYAGLTMPDTDAVRAAGFEPGREYMCLVDTKTGESGVWPEVSLQQVAYARADAYIDEYGNWQPMPKVEAAFALWLRPNGVALIPVSIADEEWELFLALRKAYDWKMRQKRVLGQPINENPLVKRR